MKLSKALKIVLIRWQITRYRLSKTSGIGQSALSKMINEREQSFTWDTVLKIALGLEAIDPVAKDAFMGALARPDDCVPDPVGEVLVIDGFDADQIVQESISGLESDLRKQGSIDQAKGAEQAKMVAVLALHNAKRDPHTEDPSAHQ